jgi:hypothetical protein
MFYTFVFTAVTLPVTGRAENLFTKKTTLFRLEAAVIYGFRILNFTEAPGADNIRRGYIYGNSFERIC